MRLRQTIGCWVGAIILTLAFHSTPARADRAVIGVGFPAKFYLVNGAIAVGKLTCLDDWSGLGCLVRGRAYTYPPAWVVCVETATGTYFRSNGTFVYVPRR